MDFIFHELAVLFSSNIIILEYEVHTARESVVFVDAKVSKQCPKQAKYHDIQQELFFSFEIYVSFWALF